MNKHLESCSFCMSKTQLVLDLGFLPPVNDMPSAQVNQIENVSFPLSLSFCNNCMLTQIREELPSDIVFPDSYPYLSSATRILRENFAHQAVIANNMLHLAASDLVIDIGSNDGTLLSNYKNFSRVLGIEPTQAAIVAEKNNIPTIKNFFNKEVARRIVQSEGKAKLVTACNVFAHIPDLKSLMENILEILDDDGIFLSESHYLLDLVEKLQFDTIYHEHLRYYDINFLKALFSKFGLEIIEVQRIPTHGGSVRVFAARKGKFKINPTVTHVLDQEKNSRYFGISGLLEFSERVALWRNDFRKLISEIRLSGSNISGIGAPSRASTLIGFSGLTHLDLTSVGEISTSHKIGRLMPGTCIPIISENEIQGSIKPEYLLILSWHIAEELMEKLRMNGFKGKFIIPLPVPKVVD